MHSYALLFIEIFTKMQKVVIFFKATLTNMLLKRTFYDEISYVWQF